MNDDTFSVVVLIIIVYISVSKLFDNYLNKFADKVIQSLRNDDKTPLLD